MNNNYWKHYIFQTYAILIALASSIINSHASGALNSQDEQSALVQKAMEGDFNAVRIIAKQYNSYENKGIVDQIAEELRVSTNPMRTRTLRKSLAILGDSAARKEIITNIQCEDRYDQFHAIQDAADIGGNDMIVILAEKLFDDSPGGRPADRDGQLVEDVGLPAPRHAAVIALSRIIIDPTAPRIDHNRITYSDDDVQHWRDWWKVNSEKYVGQQ